MHSRTSLNRCGSWVVNLDPKKSIFIESKGKSFDLTLKRKRDSDQDLAGCCLLVILFTHLSHSTHWLRFLAYWWWCCHYELKMQQYRLHELAMSYILSCDIYLLVMSIMLHVGVSTYVNKYLPLFSLCRTQTCNQMCDFFFCSQCAFVVDS